MSPWPAPRRVTGGVGGCGSGAGPLLTRAGVSRGDRSKELLTGGPWLTHTHTHCTFPWRCCLSTSFHRKLEWKSTEHEKLSASFLSHCYFICCFAKHNVEDRQRQYWYLGVRTCQEVFINSPWRNSQKERFTSLGESENPLIVLLFVIFMCGLSIIQILNPQKDLISNCSLLISLNPFLSFLFLFFLPGWHPSPCGRPPLLWQLCQCKLLRSVWSGLSSGRAQYLQAAHRLLGRSPNKRALCLLCLDSLQRFTCTDLHWGIRYSIDLNIPLFRSK